MKYILKVESQGSVKFVNAVKGMNLNISKLSMTSIFEGAKVFESGEYSNTAPDNQAEMVEIFLKSRSLYKDTDNYKCEVVRVKIVLDNYSIKDFFEG